MAALKKTPAGTIGAYHHNKGIAIGIHGARNTVSLEYNEQTGKIELLIMEEALKTQNIDIKIVDTNWNPKTITEDELFEWDDIK